jgi:hypothetical protein
VFHQSLPIDVAVAGIRSVGGRLRGCSRTGRRRSLGIHCGPRDGRASWAPPLLATPQRRMCAGGGRGRHGNWSVRCPARLGVRSASQPRARPHERPRQHQTTSQSAGARPHVTLTRAHPPGSTRPIRRSAILPPRAIRSVRSAT